VKLGFTKRSSISETCKWNRQFRRELEMIPVSEMSTLIKSSRKPLCSLHKSIFHRKPAASRRLTGITIKLQRFHGFTPAAIKNTAKSIFQMN